MNREKLLDYSSRNSIDTNSTIHFFNRKLFFLNLPIRLQISASLKRSVIFLDSHLTFEIVVSESKIIKGLISTDFSYRRQEDNNYRLKEPSLCAYLGMT